MKDIRHHLEPVKASAADAMPVQIFVFLAVAVLYVANRFFLKGLLSGTPLGPFFIGYFNDLLAPSALLSLANIVFALRGFQTTKPLFVILATALAGVCWEFLAPAFNPASVTDPLDLLVYFAGAFLYLALLGLLSRR